MYMNKVKGKVYLVGAGPGRPDLITLRGMELIKQADCVICDKLANPDLLDFAKENAEIIHVPKRIGLGGFTQQQINVLMTEKANQGKIIVRLKGGDPCIFGRGAEEAELLANHNIEFEIVPGVTASVAAAEYAAAFLTDRNYSSQVVFVTGKEADDKIDSNIDWDLLAKFRGTVVFYMAMGTLKKIVEKLTANGLDTSTPVTLVCEATTPKQRILEADLQTVVEKSAKEDIQPPAMIIIGQAAKIKQQLNWFTNLPLFSKNIVITRDRNGNLSFKKKLIAEGANPIVSDCIKLVTLTDQSDFLKTLSQLYEFEWIVFTSANGVRIFFKYLHFIDIDARAFASIKFAAIGPETASALKDFGIKADFVPSVYTSKDFGKELIKTENLKDKQMLLLRSEQASNELVKILESVKAKVTERSVYTIVENKFDTQLIYDRLAENKIDWLTFASPTAVRNFFEQIDVKSIKDKNINIASIGPVTSRALENMHLNVNAQAVEHTIDGLIEAIRDTYL